MVADPVVMRAWVRGYTQLKPMTGPPMDIRLYPDATGDGAHHARPIPYTFRQEVKEQVDEMVANEVIRMVSTDSERKSFVFPHLRFFASLMYCSFTIVCIFSTNFRSFGQQLKSQTATQQTSSKFLLLRKPMKAPPSFRCLSYLLQPKS